MRKSTSQLERYSAGIKIQLSSNMSGNKVIEVDASDVFDEKYRGATFIVGDKDNNLYDNKYLSQKRTEANFTFPKNNVQEYKIAIVKEGIVGFDEFYKFKGDRLLKV